MTVLFDSREMINTIADDTYHTAEPLVIVWKECYPVVKDRIKDIFEDDDYLALFVTSEDLWGKKDYDFKIVNKDSLFDHRVEDLTALKIIKSDSGDIKLYIETQMVLYRIIVRGIDEGELTSEEKLDILKRGDYVA